MKSQTTWTLFLSVLASIFSLGESVQPILDVKDARFRNWKPPGPGDSRSADPELNSLANHGFLPHNGRHIDAVDIILASFKGLGMSPEVPAIMVLKGLGNANLSPDAKFDLSDMDRHSWGLRQTRSLSREDLAPGGTDLPPADTSRFQKRPWDVALRVMEKCGGNVDAGCYGRARATRVRDGNTRPPKVPYDKESAADGAVEAAGMILTLGGKNGAKLKFIKSLFEQERLPYHLGWRPVPFSGGVDELLDVAAETQQADQILRCTSNGRTASRIDIFKLLESSRPGFVNDVKALIKKAGFNRQSIFDELDKIEAEKSQDQSQNEKLQSECGKE